MQFKAIPDWPGYFVSDVGGEVRSQWTQGGNIDLSRWRKLTPTHKNAGGHLAVGLHKNRVLYKRLVHQLVLETFEGPCPQGMECLHDDGDPTNNDLANLRWGTHSENMRDSIRHGRHYFSNIDAEERKRIRAQSDQERE